MTEPTTEPTPEEISAAMSSIARRARPGARVIPDASADAMLRLREVDGLRVPEIAERYRVSVRRVYEALARARERQGGDVESE
jgi:hypothetical protein